MRTARLSGLSTLTAIGLGLVGLAILSIMWMKGAFILAGFVFALIPLVMAGLVATRIAWMPALAAVVAILYFLEARQMAPLPTQMSDPVGFYPWMLLDFARLIQAVGSLTAAAAGIGATLRHYWPTSRPA